MRVFVYGTLMRKGRLNDYMTDGGATFVSDATVLGRLYSVGGSYPALVYDPEGGQPVAGEIWEVPVKTVQTIDHVEGYTPGATHNHYDRKIVKAYVAVDPNWRAPFLVYAYLYTQAKANDRTLTLVQSGDWRLYDGAYRGFVTGYEGYEGYEG